MSYLRIKPDGTNCPNHIKLLPDGGHLPMLLALQSLFVAPETGLHSTNGCLWNYGDDFMPEDARAILHDKVMRLQQGAEGRHIAQLPETVDARPMLDFHLIHKVQKPLGGFDDAEWEIVAPVFNRIFDDVMPAIDHIRANNGKIIGFNVDFFNRLPSDESDGALFDIHYDGSTYPAIRVMIPLCPSPDMQTIVLDNDDVDAVSAPIYKKREGYTKPDDLKNWLMEKFSPNAYGRMMPQKSVLFLTTCHAMCKPLAHGGPTFKWTDFNGQIHEADNRSLMTIHLKFR